MDVDPPFDLRLLSGPERPGRRRASELRFQLVARLGLPTFADLPWQLPLEEWESERFVDVARGISRHVVRFVEYDGTIYALKELPERLATREYRLLRRLAEVSIPVVEAIGVVSGRGGDDELDAVLITRFLDFSLPYRTLFAGRGTPEMRTHLLDALANLLVRIHLVGFAWGDCSLSNTLFRRDAGSLEAYLVDAETGELHDELTRGQRGYDVELAALHVAGELLDLQAAAADGAEELDELDPVEVAEDLTRRYEALYCEVTREEIFRPDESFRVERRVRLLNELGYDVEEIELIRAGELSRLRLDPRVVEPGHHRRRLHILTGLEVQENQARRLLNDMARYRSHLERTSGRPVVESVAAYRWLAEVFEPSIAAIPPELAAKREPAEVFHEVLDHRWFLSERAGTDVGTEQAVASYVKEILPHTPDEKLAIER